MSSKEITPDEQLKQLGVTKMSKTGYCIQITIGERLLTFDVEKQVSKTLKNLRSSATDKGLNTDILNELERILFTASNGYLKYLLLEQQEEKSQQQQSETEHSSVIQHNVFKYSTGIPLAEQIKLGEDYVFLQIVDDKPVISPSIDLSKTKKIVLYPRENTPILDFQYKNEDEIKQIIEVAKTKTIDDFYFEAKSIWKKFVVATPEQITLLTTDSIFTFFQDRFETTHYTTLVARVGSGKGAILISFTYLAYRVILGGNMSGASILGLLGSLERGQVVIAEDELNNLKNDSDKWRLYTIGYDVTGLTTKTLDGSTSKRRVNYYPAFCYKIIGAETSLDTTGLEGLIDRRFEIKPLKGKPDFYVKKLHKPKLSPKYEALLSEIIYYRKVMLIYRLLHANDLFEEVETNIDGRALELTGPTIDLFYTLSKEEDKSLLKKEILPVLSFFLRQKGEISKNSLDNILFSIVKEFSDKSKEDSFFVLNEDLYTNVRIACGGEDIKNGTFDSPLVGEVSQRKISNHCRDKLKAKDFTTGTGNQRKRGLLFNKQDISYLEASYNIITEIDLIDNNNLGTVELKNDPTGYKIGNLTKNEQASPAVKLNNLQEITKDSENIGNSSQSDTIEGVKNGSNSSQNTSLSLSQSLFSVPQFQTSKQKVSELLGNYVAFDLEWTESADNIIEAVSFVDSNGNNNNNEVKFRDRDFAGSEIALLNYIMAKLLNYQWSVGWNTQGNPTNAGSTKNSDLSILHQRCKANGISCIVELGNRGVPYLVGSELKHIDLCNVYRKAMVKDGMYNSYRTNKLDDVSKALLGYGKYKDHSGKDFKSLPIDEALEYSLDSQLVMELSKLNNFEVLDAMLAISKITQLDFEKVCRTNLSTWWGAIFDNMIRNGECREPTRLNFDGTYKGAEVLAPKKGLYNNCCTYTHR